MRICILTQPLERNYGGILQAYALQKALRDLGHQPTTLRFMPLYAQTSSRVELYWKTFRRFLSKLKGNRYINKINPEKEWEYFKQFNSVMEGFIRTNIHCLDVRTPLKYKSLPKFDAFIVGSDQVWRAVFSPCLPHFFLDFLEDAPVRRIAYAASFGLDFWETPEQTTEIIRPLAQRFDRISVRELSGVDLCKTYLGVDAELMPDPTLLLTREDYLALCDKTSEATPTEPYVAVYVIDSRDKTNELIARFEEEHQLPVVRIGRFNWENGSEPMESWIRGFARARYVITDSFHGTVFSLIFGKDFITFNNGWRGAGRFHTLLDNFDLADRLVDADKVSEISIPPIDRERVCRGLAELREKGISFLAEATSTSE